MFVLRNAEGMYHTAVRQHDSLAPNPFVTSEVGKAEVFLAVVRDGRVTVVRGELPPGKWDMVPLRWGV